MAKSTSYQTLLNPADSTNVWQLLASNQLPADFLGKYTKGKGLTSDFKFDPKQFLPATAQATSEPTGTLNLPVTPDVSRYGSVFKDNYDLDSLLDYQRKYGELMNQQQAEAMRTQYMPLIDAAKRADLAYQKAGYAFKEGQPTSTIQRSVLAGQALNQSSAGTAAEMDAYSRAVLSGRPSYQGQTLSYS